MTYKTGRDVNGIDKSCILLWKKKKCYLAIVKPNLLVYKLGHIWNPHHNTNLKYFIFEKGVISFVAYQLLTMDLRHLMPSYNA